MSQAYQRFTIAFIDASGRVLGSEGLEVEMRRAADAAFLAWAALDVLKRRGPSNVQGLRAAMLIGKYTDADLANTRM